MTHAQIYELGTKAYLAGDTLTDCPYHPAICSEAYDAWRDGWLDASANRAHWRRRRNMSTTHMGSFASSFLSSR